MRVAVISDIHGNLPALEAVLEEINQAEADQIVVAGDVLPGPMPHETLEYLRNVNIPIQFIQGNGDREILAQMAGVETGAIPERFREGVRWVAEQLQPADEQWLASWHKTLQLQINGLGKVLFCHATPQNDIDIFTRLTPEDHLLPIFEGLDVALVVCGHTHMQFDLIVGNIRVVNTGSVGMPYAEPGAYWLLLERDVEFRHTRYDLEQAAERVRQTKHPQAEDFAANNILKPPSEAEALEAFTRAQV